MPADQKFSTLCLHASAIWKALQVLMNVRFCILAGNNAVEMQTTATLDLERDEFVIHTPTTLAQK
jgi:hypothetical protein